jgi:hypothetical protein
MQITTQHTPKAAQARPYTTPTFHPIRRPAPVRREDQGGLSQAELRKIVIDMIG